MSRRYNAWFFIIVFVGFYGHASSRELDSLRSACLVDSANQSFINFDSVIVLIKDINTFAVYERGFLVHCGPILKASGLNSVVLSKRQGFDITGKRLTVSNDDSGSCAKLSLFYFRRLTFALTLQLSSSDAKWLSERVVRGSTVVILDTLNHINY